MSAAEQWVTTEEAAAALARYEGAVPGYVRPAADGVMEGSPRR
jgi:hypothetical protein